MAERSSQDGPATVNGEGTIESVDPAAAEAQRLARLPKGSSEGPEAGAPSERKTYASICPGSDGAPIDTEVGEMTEALQSALGMPVWLLVQPMTDHPEYPYATIDEPVRNGFFFARDDLAKNGKIALVVDSPGGLARETYQVATMLKRHCGGFVGVVPRFAKSAATLLVLGAEQLYMGEDAELGPLDVQIRDWEREERSSALDEVQALERLNSVALEQFDETLLMLRVRTRKKYSALVPLALRHTAEMMTPLLDKIDTVHYAQQSRTLAVGSDYAERLLRPRYGKERAAEIAREFVNSYSEHGFVIDRDEADGLLGVAEPDAGTANAIRAFESYFTTNNQTAVGRIEEKGGADGE